MKFWIRQSSGCACNPWLRLYSLLCTGLFHEFVDDEDVRLIGIEAAGQGTDTDKHAATLTMGSPGVLHGAYSYLLQDDEGQIIDPHSISAGCCSYKVSAAYSLSGAWHSPYMILVDSHIWVFIVYVLPWTQQEPFLGCSLDYPGIGPEHSHLKDWGRAEYYSATDKEALDAFQLVSKLEGIIPALETAHAFAYLEVEFPA